MMRAREQRGWRVRTGARRSEGARASGARLPSRCALFSYKTHKGTGARYRDPNYNGGAFRTTTTTTTTSTGTRFRTGERRRAAASGTVGTLVLVQDVLLGPGGESIRPGARIAEALNEPGAHMSPGKGRRFVSNHTSITMIILIATRACSVSASALTLH
eukprot:1035379-Rhodomonas_salina.1